MSLLHTLTAIHTSSTSRLLSPHARLRRTIPVRFCPIPILSRHPRRLVSAQPVLLYHQSSQRPTTHRRPTMAKQLTLGSFFSKPNGQKGGPARQTTLAFQTASKSTRAAKPPSSDNEMPGATVDAKSEPEDEATAAASNSKKHEMEVDEDVDEDVVLAGKRKRQRNRSRSRSASPTDEPADETSVKAETKPRAKKTTKQGKTAKQDKPTTQGKTAKKEPESPGRRRRSTSPQSETKTEPAQDVPELPESMPDDWKAGSPVPFSALCRLFMRVENTTKRLEIMAYCTKFLRQVLRLTPDDALPTVLLMVNKLAADYAGVELGIGESLLIKAIGESTGRSVAVIKSDHHELGDLGLVAAKSRMNQPTMFKPRALTVRGVHRDLLAIATMDGTGAQGRKVGAIMKLLSASDADLVGSAAGSDGAEGSRTGASEAKFLVRALEGKMRLGLAERTVLVSIAHAFVHHAVLNPSPERLAEGETIVKAVFSELPSYDMIVPVLIDKGIFALRHECRLQPGIPLKPMLAKPTKSITEVLDRFDGKSFTCEYKYDGERAQIHYVAPTKEPAGSGPDTGGLLKIFSRNSEDLSGKYPDILSRLPSWITPDTQSFVLDCETVGWDRDEKKVLPFQQLQTRKRKDVKIDDVKVHVAVFAFDLLFLNGEPTVNMPMRARRDLLYKHFTPLEGQFDFATAGDTDQLDKIQELLDASLDANCEGLMVKMLDGPGSEYAPSRRSQNWLKVKKDYLDGVGDSLDLVVIGAYMGRGKRTSKYGAFLLACYDPESESFESICNIGTGFSDVMLDETFAVLSQITIDEPKPFYRLAGTGSGSDKQSVSTKDLPDVWFEPTVVWEVKTADLTVSPRYRAAINEMADGKGVSLRFPRFIRVRDDKKADQATTSKAVAEMYWRQTAVAKSKTATAADDDFEY